MPLYSRSVAILALVLALISSVSAQAQRQRRNGGTGETGKAPSQKPESDASGTPAVTLATPPEAAFLSGEASVAVTGNQNPLVRLGLSSSGVMMIEFPATDRFFALHPGNSDLVTIDESPTKGTDHFLVVRAGSGFASPATMAKARREPVTSIMAQMQSGLVITFLFYPVRELQEQAHRVVITYDREEVVAARKAAGLAVNLDSTAETATPRTTSMRIITPSDVIRTAAATADEPPPRKTTNAVADTAEIDTSQPPEKSIAKNTGTARAASLALTEATKSPKSFRKWSDPTHGLSLSIRPVQEVSKHSRVVVVAVRNTKSEDVRIMPGQPEIYLETMDGKKRPLQLEAVRKLAVETTAVDELIPSGEIRYYAVVFEPPVMGARQRLQIAVGQIAAADEPATVDLTSSNR